MDFADRPCPVCGGPDDASLFAESTYDPSRLNSYSFSSRKTPEMMHHRLLRCRRCDTLFSSPAPLWNDLEGAYGDASFDSAEEAQYASRTYFRQLSSVRLPDRVGALDIGTGEGAFLERLVESGFGKVQGVEPSRAPLQAAKPHIRGLIHQGAFSEDRYPPQSLSLVTCFQTLEHLADPGPVCRAAHRLLKPGGVFLTVCHNHRSLSAKLLGLKSPIFDIEHFQLFSPKSARRLLERSGFVDLKVYSLRNTYPLHYWMRMFPFPRSIRQALISAARSSGLGAIPLALPAGNLVAIGRKA